MTFDLSNYASPETVIGAFVILLLIVALVSVLVHRRRRETARLRTRFGAEYDLAVQIEGSRSRAEARLRERLQRVKVLNIRELTASQRNRYLAEWDALQSQFIDYPTAAVTEAEWLVNSVLQARGFPASMFEQRAEDMSVDYAHLVPPFRAAHKIALRAGRNEATTEELRTAMINFRAMLDELLGAVTAVEARALV
jgi:hypothetical protein